MLQPGKAIIVGGSLGGLFAANLLWRAGWDVQVFERAAEELEGRGAGIVVHPELMDALRQAGCQVDDSIGVWVQERVTVGADGTRVASCEMPQMVTAWSRLYHALKAAFPASRYHSGKQLVSCGQNDTTAYALFEDGTRATADMLVAADGIRSSVRQGLLPEARPIYAGYVAWRGLVEERALSDLALRDIFPYFAFGLPPDEQMIAYPVAGRNNSVAPGRRRSNFVWYRPAEEATTLRDMLTDGSDKLWSDGIPPPMIRPDVLAGARKAAREVLAPQFAEVVEKTEALLFQPIYDLESPRLAFGRVVLLGDSAFVARPHCGMGVTKAAGDAVALVQALQGSTALKAGLQAYEGPRGALGRYVVARARALGAYLEARARTRGRAVRVAQSRTPLEVMAETAVPLTIV